MVSDLPCLIAERHEGEWHGAWRKRRPRENFDRRLRHSGGYQEAVELERRIRSNRRWRFIWPGDRRFFAYSAAPLSPIQKQLPIGELFCTAPELGTAHSAVLKEKAPSVLKSHDPMAAYHLTRRAKHPSDHRCGHHIFRRRTLLCQRVPASNIRTTPFINAAEPDELACEGICTAR